MNVPIGGVPEHLMWDDGVKARGKNNLGKDDFMKLLLTQMKNQDPLKPNDHEQFAAQLAQFGSLEKLGNIEKGINGVKDGFSQEAKLQALGMIGKDVKAWGNSIALSEQRGVSFAHGMGDGVRPLRAVILDEAGATVRTIDLTSGRGSQMVEWDGKNDRGKRVPAGNYNFRLTGVDKSGKAVESGSEIVGKVVGVDVQSKVPTLVVKTEHGDQKVAVHKVSSVTIGENALNGAAKAEAMSVQDRLRQKTAHPNDLMQNRESESEQGAREMRIYGEQALMGRNRP